MEDLVKGISNLSLSRSNNKKNEDIRVKRVCELMNLKKSHGLDMFNSYESFFQKKIKEIKPSGGGLKDHYDFKIIHTDSSFSKVEEKGTKNFLRNIKTSTPWEKSVQRFNGPGNKFTVCRVFGELWYNRVVKDLEIKKEYEIESEIPSLEEWLEKDAFKFDPNTDYGKELKKKYQTRHGKTSMNGKKNSPKDYRIEVIKEFTLDDNLKNILIKEVQKRLDEIMGEKDVWLQTTGDIETDKFSFKWSKNIVSQKIKDVVLLPKSDINFLFNCEDGKSFKCILRFGKGTGFSNIRLDFK